MNVKDKERVEQAKANGSNGKHQTTKQSVETGANRIASFIDRISDNASDAAADAATAATIRKTAAKLGNSQGPLTQNALEEFEQGWIGAFDDLAELVGASESPKYQLRSASDFVDVDAEVAIPN